MTDYNLNVVAVVDLDPWGGETGRSWAQGKQPHRYTSYERDGNGNDQAMFRLYHSYWQRFDQPDPYDGSYNLSDPQSLNRYSYVQNDPVNFVDPTGLLPSLRGIINWLTKGSEGPISFAGPPDAGPSKYGWWDYYGGDEFIYEEPQNSNVDVPKNYKKSFPCNQSADKVVSTIRKDFSKFANYGGRFGPLGATVNLATVRFGNTPVEVGNSISIHTGIYAPLINPHTLLETINTSVTVTEVDSQNFSFTTVPGHVLYPASISFGASDIGNGRIAFGIHVNGNFADNIARAKYYSGGYDLENKIWRNLINNVRKFCGN